MQEIDVPDSQLGMPTQNFSLFMLSGLESLFSFLVS
jgi:hypothetical protein